MNYLGHLYLSNNDKKLMLNNLYGDFVKGKDLSAYPEGVRKGIILHRQIDDFIDHNPIVIQLQHILHDELPKVSAIAIDLYFDHLLARHWNDYHSIPLEEFLNDFYTSIDIDKLFYSIAFKEMIRNMLKYNWLVHYSTIDGLDKMCKGVSRKISFENELKNGKNIFLNHQKLIQETFRDFMEQTVNKFNIDISK